MADPTAELARDAVAGSNGYGELLTKFTSPETPKANGYSQLLTRFGAAAQPAGPPKTYDDILDGFLRPNVNLTSRPQPIQTPQVQPPQEVTTPPIDRRAQLEHEIAAGQPPENEVVQWPPPMAASGAQGEGGYTAAVGPAEKPPGLLARIGKSLLKPFTTETPEQKMAGRVFAAQAELEARQHPYWKDLPTDEAKLHLLNIFRRRYKLPPVGAVPPPQTAGQVAREEFGSWGALARKLPYVETVKQGYDIYQVLQAASRMDAGKGTVGDAELLTQLKEREAKESRGRTVGGEAVNIFGQSVPYGLELATGGIPTRLAVKGAEKLAGKAISGAVGKVAGKIAAAASEKTLPRLALHAAVQTAERGLPTWALKTGVDTLRRQVPGYVLQPGDDAALEYAMTAPPQPLLEAIRDSAIDQGVEVVSEFTGASIGIIGGGISKITGKALGLASEVPLARVIAIPANNAVQWAGNLRTKMAAEMVRRLPNKYLTFQAAMAVLKSKAGYNGVIGEIGEERIGELMKAAAKEVIEAGGGETTLPEYNPPGLDQLTAEFLGFLVPMAGTAAGAALIPEAGRGVPAGEVPPDVHIPVTSPSVADVANVAKPSVAAPGTPPVVPDNATGTISNATEDILSEPGEGGKEARRQEGTKGGDGAPVPSQEKAQLERQYAWAARERNLELGTALSDYRASKGYDHLPEDREGQQTRLAAMAADTTYQTLLAESKEAHRTWERLQKQESDETGRQFRAGLPQGEVAEPQPPEASNRPEVSTPTPPVSSQERQGEVGMMLGSGEVVRTSSGRLTTPFPEIRTDTDRKTGNTLKKVDAWLRDNAIQEAESRGDDFNARPWRAEDARNLPPATKDSMEQYLFGEQPTIPKPFLKPAVGAPDQESSFPVDTNYATNITPTPAAGTLPEVIDKSNAEISREQRIIDRLADMLLWKLHGRLPTPEEHKRYGKAYLWEMRRVFLQGMPAPGFPYGNVPDVLRPTNKASRWLYEELTGRKLPASWKSTQEYIVNNEAPFKDDFALLMRLDEYVQKGGLGLPLLKDAERKQSFGHDTKTTTKKTPVPEIPSEPQRSPETPKPPPGALVVKDLRSGEVTRIPDTRQPDKTGKPAVIEMIESPGAMVKREMDEHLVDLADRYITSFGRHMPPWLRKAAEIVIHEWYRGPRTPSNMPQARELIDVHTQVPDQGNIPINLSGGASAADLTKERLAIKEKWRTIGQEPLDVKGLYETIFATQMLRKKMGLTENESLPIAPIGSTIKGETPNARPTKQPETERGSTPSAQDRPGGEGPPVRPGQGSPELVAGGTAGDVSPTRKGGQAAPVRPGAADGGRGPDGSPGGVGDETGRGLGDRGERVPATAGVEEEGTKAETPKPAPEKPKEEPPPKAPQTTHTTEHSGLSDYSITDPAALFASGKKTVFKRNIAAIETLKNVLSENRPATEAEKAVLVKYQGWGSLSEAFPKSWGDYAEGWQKEGEQLKELLTEEEHAAAQRSTQNAMYTPPEIASGMWHTLWRMGFHGGRVLETSAGVGHFLGLQPLLSANGSRRTAVEMDDISAGILAALYPASDVRHSPFEKAMLPKNYFDVAISNVPFGEKFMVDRRYPKFLRQLIHDYFFVRAMDVIRPGGILAFITTKGTMDKLDPRTRKYIGERADLLGAVRLNESSLPGTKVTADIMFMRKRGPDEAAGGEAWLAAKPYAPLPGRYINEYFQAHPEMVLGTIKAGSQYTDKEGPTNTIVEALPDFDLARDLNAALQKLPTDVFGKVEGAVPDVGDISDMIPSPTDLPAGAHFLGPDGTVMRAGGKGNPAGRVEASLLEQHGAQAVMRVKGLVRLRDAMLELLRAQSKAGAEAEARLPELQANLNKVYDELVVDKIVPVKHAKNTKLLADDPLTLSLVESTEVYDPITRKYAKGDIFTRRLIDAYERPTTAESPTDALSISLDETNRIDVERIASLLGVEPEAAVSQMVESGLVYALPGDELVVAADYLSGNVRAKLRDAEALAKLEPQYKRNVEALTAVLPEDLPPSRIRPVMGAPWIPAEVLKDFMMDVLGERVEKELSVRRADATGRWFISAPRWVHDMTVSKQTWGTPHYSFVDLVAAEVTMKTPKVMTTITDRVTGSDKRIEVPEASAAAKTKLEQVRAHFVSWLWGHSRWGPEMVRLYNDEMNSFVPRRWDGSHMTFPGMNPAISMREHQKHAIYRGIASPNNTLVAVAVGGGKTYILIAQAVEAIRLRLARKVIIAVQKSTLLQFAKSARLLYPGQNVIVLNAKDLGTDRKARTLAKVAAAERTIFIMPHEQLTMLPLSETTLSLYYNEMIDDLNQSIADAEGEEEGGGGGGRSSGRKRKSRSVKQMENARDNLMARLEEKIEAVKRSPSLAFEELGLDWLIYDESQKVKNLAFQTQIEDIRGLGNPTGSQRATDLYIKAKYVQTLQNGRGVIFSTGTPVDNSLSEIYNIQRYLQQPQLKEAGIRSFDDWVRNFAVARRDVERVAGRYKSVNRLRAFRNLRALHGLWGNIAHFVSHEEVAAILSTVPGASPMPIVAKNSAGERTYELVILEPTPAQIAYRDVIAARVQAIKDRGGQPPEPGDDIMLSVITDEKKAAVDMRLIDSNLPEEEGNKLSAMAEKVAAIYKEGSRHNYTQLLFINQGVPGGTGFDLYHEMIRKLVDLGVPREEIATIFDAPTDEKKQALFERINKGEIRVFIGSMKRAGVGVNVQERAWAGHQIEPAWTPGELIQMEGRWLRQGNINWDDPTQPQEVRQFRYIAKGSSDEFMYSLLAAKHKVNMTFLSGKLDADEIEDVDISVAAFLMAMAQSSENQDVLEWTKLSQELAGLQAEAAYHGDTQLDLRRSVTQAKANLGRLADDMRAAQSLVNWEKTLPPAKPFVMTVGGQSYDKMSDAGTALFQAAKNAVVGEWTRAGSFRGLPVYVNGDIMGKRHARIDPAPKVAAEWKRFAGSSISLSSSDAAQPPTWDMALKSVKVNAHGRLISAGWRGTSKTLSDTEIAKEQADYDEMSRRFQEALLGSSESVLRAAVLRLTETLTKADPAPIAENLKEKKAELAEMEANLGKPFAKQDELLTLTAKVAQLAESIAKEVEDINTQAVGAVAADMGDQGGPDDIDSGGDEDGGAPPEDTDEDDSGGGGGGGLAPGFGPRQESLLPPNLTPEQRNWLRQNWAGNTPLVGMGGMAAGVPEAQGLWGWYVRSWEKWANRIKNMKTARGQRAADLFARLIWDLDWKLDQRTRNAFELTRGAKTTAARFSENLVNRLNAHVAEVRAKGVGQKWPEDAWNVLRAVAKAVSEGGNRKPETLPADLRKVWDEHFASWVKRLPSEVTGNKRREAIAERLENIDQRIKEVEKTTVGHPMPNAAWDVYALTEHRLIQDVARGKRPYEDISPAMRDWLNNLKTVLDQLTDEILEDPALLEQAKAGGLVNLEEIIELRRSKGLPYLRRLYTLARGPSDVLGAKNRLLAPRLTLGMFKPKRADEQLWTVQLANGQSMQFADRDEAIDFVERERIKWRPMYGESVESRVRLIKPLTEDDVEWLGPVEDMRILLTRTITDLWHNVETAKLFNSLAQTEAITEGEYKDLDDEEQRYWRKLPNSVTLGPLADLYVPEAIHYNLMEMQWVTTGFLSQLWNTYLNIFKSMTVLLSAKTWFNNLYGQTFMWIMRGINPLTHFGVFKEAARRLAEGLNNPTFIELSRRNELNGGWDKEGADKFLEFLNTPGGNVTAAAAKLFQWMQSAGKTLGRGYSFVDDVSVMASWIQDREVEGLPEEIALENLRWFQNYRRLGKAAKYIRSNPLGDPFISFSDQMVKIIAKSMREHPGRVLAFYGIPGIINFSSRLLLGVTDDEMAILDTTAVRNPEGLFGGVQGVVDRYFQPILPFPRDARGRVRTLDMRWQMPLASDFRVATGPGGIGIPFMLKQPLITPTLELVFNRKLFSGQDVSNVKKPTAWQAWRTAKHLAWGSLPAPSLAVRAPQRMYEAATGKSGENLIEVVLKEVFGINILPQNANKAEAYRLVKKALGEGPAGQAARLIAFYERYRGPKDTPITAAGLKASIAADKKRAGE